MIQSQKHRCKKVGFSSAVSDNTRHRKSRRGLIQTVKPKHSTTLPDLISPEDDTASFSSADDDSASVATPVVVEDSSSDLDPDGEELFPADIASEFSTEVSSPGGSQNSVPSNNDYEEDDLNDDDLELD